ncbi:MAG: N-acetylneuraminate synthase family protein [Pseudomonadota bacterium]
MGKFQIKGREISDTAPVYFIADIASNHNGDLGMAKALICSAKEKGADAVKFQHFLADKIVSDYGFKRLGRKLSHQSSWDKSVFDIYRQYECNRNWLAELAQTAQDQRVDFLSTPYDFEAIDLLDDYVPAFKIGSGDITWLELIEKVAKKNKPVMLATGASTMEDVQRAMAVLLTFSRNIVLMQCNTNYTGESGNLGHINLNVLTTYRQCFPDCILGLSDHTHGCTTVLGAVALGARVIEKHYTLDNSLPGPDHPFSMNPASWKEMILKTRELESALGDGRKTVERNEKESFIVQRRCLRYAKDIQRGTILTPDAIEALRPLVDNCIHPFEIDSVLGKTVKADKLFGEPLIYQELE